MWRIEMLKLRILSFPGISLLKFGFPVLTLLALVACSSDPFVSRQDLFGQFSKDEKKGHFLQAKSDLSKILKSHPSDAIAWNDLAYLDFLGHHYRKAEGDLAQGLAVNPHNSFLLLNQSRILLAQGKNREARTLLLSMLPSHPWPKGFRMMLAIADSRTGHKEAARLLFEEILSRHPDDTLASLYLTRLNRESSRIKVSENG